MENLKGGRLPYPSAQIASVASAVLRALSVCAPAALAGASTAMAQAAASANLTADIPAQPLAQALAAFAQQTSLQLVYVSGVVRDQQSQPVTAGLGASEALARLLQGTGLRFEFLTAHSVRILAATPPPHLQPRGLMVEPSAEVIVTATRRAENAQDVPITIQVISGPELNQLGVYTFNDLLKYTANISYSGNGPATGNIFMRGLGSVGTGNQTQATAAPFPNVALYLDDQSMQFPSRNNDVYLVDLERIEVLEGPQGTLFGGGAEAGAIRYITHKPELDATTGEAIAAYGITAGGAPNTKLSAVVNLTPIPETLALRAVAFSDREGGYISNVPGSISLNLPSPSVPGVNLVSPAANNANLVATDANPITYQGLRVSALYQVNDDWTLLIQQNYQDMDAEGYFYAYPFDSNGNALGPYQITAFTPAYTRDRYESTAWTLNGAFGGLKAVYTGSYMIRHIEGQQDYSNYLHSALGAYYDCVGTGAPYFLNPLVFPQLAGKPLKCYPPVASWHDTLANEHQSHELRFSTNEHSRARALFGAYWEKFVIDDQMNFNDLTIPQCSPGNLAIALRGGPDCVSAIGPVPGAFASDAALRENINNSFGTDVQRGYKQYAFFVSVDFDIIPKFLTATAGTRRYHYDEFEEGSEWYTETTSTPLILDHPNGACTAAGLCGYPINLSKSEGGFRSRANLTWHITPDVMAYYTFSQGFRPGGFNRARSLPGQAPKPVPTAPYCAPFSSNTDPRCLPGGSLFQKNSFQFVESGSYASDQLINNEIGLKSELFDHRLLLNASLYRLNWNNVQSLALDLAGLTGAYSYANGPSYTVNGLELQLMARITEALTLQASSAWNSSSLTSDPCLRSAGITPSTPNNPTPAGECLTIVEGLPYSTLGAPDTSAPYSPPLVFNLRARYDWAIGAYQPFFWVGAGHIDAMRNEPASFPTGVASFVGGLYSTGVLRYTIPAYTTYDAAAGVTRENWTVQLTGTNLTNVYGPTNISSAQFIKAYVPLRPRVVMAQLTYRF